MKGVLERLGLGLPSVGAGGDAKRTLNLIIDEFVEARREQNIQWESVKSLKDSPRWVALMEEPDEDQIDVALAALSASKHGQGGGGGWDYWLRRDTPHAAARMILQKKSLSFSDAQIAAFVRKAARAPYLEYQFPVGSILGACERHLGGARPEGEIRAALEAFTRRIDGERQPTKAVLKLGMRAKTILDPDAGVTATLPKGAFAGKLLAWTGTSPARDAFVAHLGPMLDKSKPTKKWLKEGAELAAAKEVAPIWNELREWIAEETPDPENADLSYDLLKALIWLAPPALVPDLGRFCQVCYKKIPGIGARSVKLGNACLLAFEGMAKDPGAVAELARLSREIKYPSVRDQIAKRLARVAEAQGVTVETLEDRSLPDFGLDPNGTTEVPVGDYVACLRVSALDTTLEWRNADGKTLKSVPKPVKDSHADTLKELKVRAKDIEGARKATVTRLEASWIDGLDWELSDWLSLFDGHPVRRGITRTLIWQIETGDQTIDAMPEGDGWNGPDGKAIDIPKEGRISLWHPLHSTPDRVLAWRRRILARGQTQPIKQAHREVYVLTDAERRTEVYSNRFAAHILRQHQFKALCDARGWRYTLMGTHFDGHNIPNRALPSQGLYAEYTVDVVEDGDATEAGIAAHIATDQVCFLDENYERVALTDIAPIVFSELLRDVDLFVAVTSVANDPGWTDGGPEGRFGRYWQQHAFGDLTQSAETRKQLLEDLLPNLAIGDKCRIEDRYLIVQGKLNEYAIHLGSSNIQIRPSNRYLCIVPGRSPRDQVRLPFAGDATLSIILSKAYMLIEDNKITDKTILNQLGN